MQVPAGSRGELGEASLQPAAWWNEALQKKEKIACGETSRFSSLSSCQFSRRWITAGASPTAATALTRLRGQDSQLPASASSSPAAKED